MTDKQRLALLSKARVSLRSTTEGYNKVGVHWRTADKYLDQLAKDLAEVTTKVPNLGPMMVGGKSVLLHDLTHLTSNLGWPAFDEMGAPGKLIIAPETCTVYDNTSSAQGGDAFYVRGASGMEYWVAHIKTTMVPKLNRVFKKGEKMTEISADHKAPHCHWAINAVPLIGKHLKSHTDYTHGAPLIGVQLIAALDT